MPKKTPERTEAFRTAWAAQGFTDAALQAYAKDCRHASGWIEEHLDAPVCQKLAARAYRAVLRTALGKAKRVRFKGQLVCEGKPYQKPERALGQGITHIDAVTKQRITVMSNTKRSEEETVLLPSTTCPPIVMSIFGQACGKS